MKQGYGQRKAVAHRTETLESFMRLYGPALRRFFQRKISADADVDVDDLMQDVFLRLSRIDDPQKLENPQAYIFQIAQNILRDRGRRKITRSENFHEEFKDEAHGARGISTERVVLGREAVAQVKQAILNLPDKTAHVFVLSRFDGLTYREISETLSISVSSVEKHMMKALYFISREVDR